MEGADTLAPYKGRVSEVLQRYLGGPQQHVLPERGQS
jgi:hypothetical protein